jgi:hypothetical protein
MSKMRGLIMPRKKKSRDIICAECPDIYSEEDIMASRGEESRPLVDVLGRTMPEVKGVAPVSKKRALGRLIGKESVKNSVESRVPNSSAGNLQREKLRNLGRLKDWTFTCPKGHLVDGNRGYQIPLAVVGPSGSSKSHFLPGLIWETSLMRVLSPLGVTLRKGQFTSAVLGYSMDQLYKAKELLAATPPNEVAGPFSYRLTIREEGEDTRYSLLLFDVGGEALSTITKISEQAPFVLLAQGLIVLIDPQNVVSTRFDDVDAGVVDRERVIAASRVRDEITLIADALEELWGGSMKQIPIPTCFVVAKADSINWTFDWESETPTVVEHVRAGEDLRKSLLGSSSRVKDEFTDFGGALIVEEIEERFAADRMRFAAVSATCEMPLDNSWVNPTPAGISLALLHVLDMLGKLHVNPPKAQEPARSIPTQADQRSPDE